MIAAVSQSSSLDPLLLPDRDEPYQLLDVFEKRVYGLRDEIVLDFGDCFLRFKAEPDYDTIAARFHGRAFGSKRGYQSISSAPPWRRFLKKNCGCTWSALSQQGYWDTILISFDAVIPNLLLYVMASSIFVGTIGPLKDRLNEKGSKARRSKESASQN